MSNLLPAIQHWPILYIIAPQAKLAAKSKSASGAIITGVFPPNSTWIFFKFVLLEYSKIFLPIKVEPVNETLWILSETHKASPASYPYPVNILKTPGGNPASLTN